MLAYVGKMFIVPAVKDLCDSGLRYWWQLIIQHTGGNRQIWKRKIYTSYRPVLVFAKEPVRPAPRWVFESVRGGGRDKRFHEWGQDVDETTAWIEGFTDPNDLIVDPFVGGGTVPMVCLATKRSWIGTEIDPKNAAAARSRLDGERRRSRMGTSAT